MNLTPGARKHENWAMGKENNKKKTCEYNDTKGVEVSIKEKYKIVN